MTSHYNLTYYYMAIPKQLKAWHEFVAKYWSAHKDLSYKEVLKEASRFLHQDPKKETEKITRSWNKWGSTHKPSRKKAKH
jgi:hypothetical protein